MKASYLSLLMAGLIGTAVSAANFQVLFETTTCTGESGFAAAEAADVYKIETAACSAPGKAGEKLKKILIKNGQGSYDTFTLTASEAKNVIADLKAYQRARLKSLENADTLMISK